MAKASMLGLKTKGASKESLTFKIDSDLLEDLKVMEERVEKELPGQKYERSEVVEEALKQSVRSITAELDRRKAATV